MRVNEVISRCSTDQSAKIYYEGKFIEGNVYEIIATEEYRLNKIGDMLVTNINCYNSDLRLKAVKA